MNMPTQLESPRITVLQIQRACAEHYELTAAQLLSASRVREVARPRQVGMWLSRRLTARSLPDIGRRFGGRDHTTVIHAVRRIDALRAADPLLARDLKLLTRKLRGCMSDTGDERPTLLATEDVAMLEAVKTGEGLVPMTPERLKGIMDGLAERRADIAARFPALVSACDYETLLAVAAWVFQHVAAHAREGGSFRYLIYDRLGFDYDAYVPLYIAGGMEISNQLQPAAPQPEAAQP